MKRNITVVLLVIAAAIIFGAAVFGVMKHREKTNLPQPSYAETTAAEETLPLIDETTSVSSPETVPDTTQALTLPVETAGSPVSGISLDEAKQIALDRAGLTADEVKFVKAKLDNDDGIPEYEIEFVKGIFEYSCEIDADDGSILDYEKELND